MAKTNGTILYPLKSGVNEADANEAYASMTTEFSTGKAFKDVSVNPVLKATYVESETSGTGTATSDVVPSVIFTEIRKGSHGGSISNDKADQIGNRLLPKNKTIANYAITKETTPPFKIKAYDTSISAGETNRKFVYADTSLGASVIDHPATDVVALDIENYDYFIMLNPEIYDASTQTDTARPHFAKITRISTFDEFGDGLEFSPKYPTSVPKGTNFEIFKGPAKTDTDVMAVSYGLRGDNQASTDNYDVLNRVDRPTFYFYNDRLEQDDQLDYMEKYTVTRLRWWGYNPQIGMVGGTDVGFTSGGQNYAIFDEGSSSKKLFVNTSSYSDFMNIVFQGMSLFRSTDDSFVGNVKTINTSDNSIELDFARQASSVWGGSSYTLVYGKGIQNIVFRTEARLKGTIPNIGRRKLDATLVDNLRTTDDGDSNFNPILWHKAFPNMKRHTSDSTSATSATLDGNRTGPSRYITSDPRPRRNDIIPFTTDVIVNNPQNKMSKIFKAMSLNNSGMMPHKIREGQKLKAMKTTFSDKMTFKKLPFKASKVDGANEIRFTDMFDTHDYALSTKLATNSIIKIDGYYYVINAVQSKSSGTQDVTVKANKTLKATTFTVTPTVHEFVNEDVEIAAWTGVLNTEDFDSDTQVVYADGNRLTVSGTTIPKEDSKFHDTKVVFTNLSTHQNHVDYIDKDMEYVKFQDASRKFYQNTNIQRFYYYTDTYNLQEEVFDGTVELSETSAENGLSTLVIEGRDTNAALLNTLIDKNLSFSEDMVYSTLNPIIPALNEATLDINAVSGKNIGHATISDWDTTAKARTLLFTRSTNQDGTINNQDEHMIFIGEVASAQTSFTTLTHEPLVTLSNTATDIYYYDPHAEATYLTGKKAIGSNPSITNSTTDFSRVSDKGLVFSDSFSFDRTDNRTKLESTSNTASFDNDRTLGYDIASPISINSLNTSTLNADSAFAIQLSKETGVSTTKINKMTYASEMFDIVETISKDDGGFKMSIAPICPLVMARLENNASDSRSGYSFYMVNNNVNTGGFIHRVDPQIGQTGNQINTFYTPKETYRYWDTQVLQAGTITKSDAGIYESPTQPQAISAYSIAYPIKANGIAPDSPTLSVSSAPLLGSNMNDSNYTLRHATGSSFTNLSGAGSVNNIVPPSHAISSTGSINTRISTINKLLHHAPKAQNYEIFATGDLFPYSKLRYNNIGSQTLNFEDLACLLESSGKNSTTSVSHSSYSGTTKMIEKTDTNYERASIKSASTTTNNIKRFGIARLVEATFDWHFNPVDPDSLPAPDDALLDIERYQMYALRETTPLTLAAVRDGSGNNTLTFTGGGTLALAEGDAVFRADTGELVFIVKGTITGMSSGSNNINLVNVTGDITALNTPAYLIRQYSLLSFEIFKFEDGGFQTPILTNNNFAESQTKVDFTSVYLARPNYYSENGIFKYARLSNGGVSNNFDPPSVFIPFVFKSSTHSTNPIVSDLSPYHPEYTWHTDTALNSGNDFFINSSRVIAGLVHRVTGINGGTTDVQRSEKYGLHTDAHPYENCIGVFRNIRKISTDGPNVPTDMFQTSAILGSRQEQSDHTAYVTGFDGGANNNATDLDQHTINTMIFQNHPHTYAITGTHTRSGRVDNTGNSGQGTFTDLGVKYFLGSKEGEGLAGARHDVHDASPSDPVVASDFTSSSNGGLYRAQMMIKPVLDITDTNVSLSQTNSARDTITIVTSNADSQHTWISFVPNLTGYYLVAEKTLERKNDLSLGLAAKVAATAFHRGEIFQSGNGGNIGFMAKILSHTTNQTSNSASSITHVIKLDRGIEDNDLFLGNQMARRPRFRLMRLAETTFRDTPKEIILNRLHSTGLDYSETTSRYDTGNRSGNSEQHLDEGVFSAYVLMNLDKAPETSSIESIVPETPSNSVHNIPFSNGDVFDCFITDGTNRQRKLMTFTDVSASVEGGVRQREAKLTYEGTLTGNGVVSFGEIIELELDRQPNLNNVTKCHIGTSMIIGEEVETEIERIAKEAGLDIDMVQSQAEFTGNIVSSVSNNVITCKATVENIVAGDTIFTHEGYPIGVVASDPSGTTITVNNVDDDDNDVDLWFVPLVNDEIIKFNKKTFVTTDNFIQTSAFDALNKLAGKKNLDFRINKKKVVFRDLNSAALLRKQAISYRSHRIFSVKKNSSLFAKANKVTVIGDRIRTSVANDESGTHINFVDANIRTITDAKVKANELLELHSSDARKITLNVEKKGLETLEAGDIIYLDFPQYDIPPNDYVIFEIENILTPTLTMTVGTFDKTIAERLSEIGSKQSSSSSTLFSRNSQQVSVGKVFKDSIPLKTTLVQYTITGTGETANMGFDDLFGFGETVGFETTAGQVIGYYTSED